LLVTAFALHAPTYGESGRNEGVVMPDEPDGVSR
jgi:hypothetical protein